MRTQKKTSLIKANVNFSFPKQVHQITKWFKSVKLSDLKLGSESQEGIREQFKEQKEDGELIFTQVPISEEEEKCRQWVLHNEIRDYLVEEDMNCPQQPSGS